MLPEKPPFERIDITSDPPKSHYDQKLSETREKCLPLLERLVGKFSEYKKICTALQEKRPSLEWLNKLEATCEKIQKKMTAQFFEKLDEAESENRSNTVNTVEKAGTEIVSYENLDSDERKIQKRSRWDVMPTYGRRKNEKYTTEKDLSQSDKRGVGISADKNRHEMEKGLKVIDLTENEGKEELLNMQKTSKPQLEEFNEQDSDVEIIASTAGYNPLRRVRSQNQFASLEEVNRSPFYKNFTSDNMVLDSRAANLKYGTVVDLVKSKAQSSETRHRKYSQRRWEGLSRRPNERKESWPRRGDFENKKYHMDNYDRKPSLTHNKPHVTNLVNDKTYKDLQIAVKFFDRNKESKAPANPRRLDDTSSKTKCGKSGNEFQGKMPFYKQNTAGGSRYSYPEKSFSSQNSRDPVLPSPPDLYPVSSESFPSNQNVTNTQYTPVGYPQQACSFHCNCYKKTPYFSSIGAPYQPTTTCVPGNSNYAFFSGQYFPNQPVVSPSNTNLPSPFPTYAVPPLPTVALAASISPYVNANKPGYSVPVFCNEEITSTNKTAPTSFSWNPTNRHHQELTCRNVVENSNRPKDPRTDTTNVTLTQSTPNIAQRLSTTDSVLKSISKNSCFSGISEERFSQSCTFLRPDNLYRDFKCHSDDFRNSSMESLKSFGLKNDMTNEKLSSEIDLLNKPIVPNLSYLSNYEDILKASCPESNKCNKNSHCLQSIYNIDKQEESKITHLQHLENTPFSPKEKCFNKEKFLEMRTSSKRAKEQKSNPHDSLTNLLKPAENTPVSGKQKSVEKDKFLKNSRPHNKFETTKYEPDCSYVVQPRPSEKIQVPQKGKLDFKTKENGKISSFKKSKEQMSNPNDSLTNQVKPVDNTTVPETRKTVENEKLLRNNISYNQFDTGKVEPNCSHIDELQPSEKISVPPKAKFDCKVKAIENISSYKSSKGHTSNSYDSLTIQLKHAVSTPIPEKQKSVEKDKFLKNSISYSKFTTTKIEQNGSHVAQLQPSGNISVPLIETLNCKSKANGKISSSKKVKEQISNLHEAPANQFQPPENAQSPEKFKSVEKEKSTKNGRLNNKSVKSKVEQDCSHIVQQQTSKKIVISQKSKVDFKAIGKVGSSKKVDKKCDPADNSNFNLPPTEIALVSQKEKSVDKEKVSEKDITLNRSTSDKKKCTNSYQNHQKDASSEKAKCSGKIRTSNKAFISKNKDDSKISISQEGKPTSNKGKSFDKPASSKKPITTVKDKSLENVSPSKKHTTHTNIITDTKIIYKGIKSNAKEKCLERINSSKKRRVNQIKDCSVVLKRDEPVAIDKSEDNNEKSKTKDFVDSKPTSEKIQSNENVKFTEINLDSKQQISDVSKCSDKTGISQKKKKLEKEKNSSEDISNNGNDKVKDLVLRMKSLSQSEALKVISEFASMLKVDESHQMSIHVSKDQRVPSKEEEIEHTNDDIKIKDEIIDDYSEVLQTENNDINIIIDNSEPIGNTTKIRVYNTVKNSSLSSESMKDKLIKTTKRTQNKTEQTLQETGVNIKIANIDLQSTQVSSNTDKSSEKRSTSSNTLFNTVYKESSDKSKFNKKRKLSELEKIHADLESCHGLDDIMKCSGLRTCRLKNESGSALKENTIDDKQIKKRRTTDSSEEPFFIEDEITIKMEPIPELTFDFIKQEPDYFE